MLDATVSSDDVLTNRMQYILDEVHRMFLVSAEESLYIYGSFMERCFMFHVLLLNLVHHLFSLICV